DILAAHNEKRALHGVPNLTWDNAIAEYAANYAASNFNCNNVQLIHSGGPYGENLAAGYPGGYSPVDAWYNEISLYNFADPGFSESTGHFTQVVWKGTSRLGCARVICDNAWGQYTICEYTDTRGNIVGTDPTTGLNFFAENVLPPLSS
ncbi:PR-1-like protein, partial [Scheffersomyces amazonensis]|uniref:PR-1-like protein n=1 Tax=Scheffersomyces amazonensis TaxID=1078765 RepID=UPI00315DA1CA